MVPKPKSVFLHRNDIIFRFEHEKEASEFAQYTSGSILDPKDHHSVYISPPKNLRHVRSYLWKDKCCFVFNHDSDATKFYNDIHQKGQKKHEDGTYRVYVPSSP